METISLILAALAAGAGTGLSDVVADEIKASYKELRAALRRKLAGEPTAEALIDDFIVNPAEHKEPLETMLWQAGADRDTEVIATAGAILERADPQAGHKYKVTVDNSDHVQVGDHNIMFGTTHRSGT
jgi:hypothetical protein